MPQNYDTIPRLNTRLEPAVRPDTGRRFGMFTNFQEHPGRRTRICQTLCCCLGPSVPSKTPGCYTRCSPQRVPRTPKYCNGNSIKNSRPAMPAMNLQQVVGPHQPHETRPGLGPRQGRQGISSIAGPTDLFKIADPDPGLCRCHVFCRRHPACEFRHAVGRFQRILRRHQPPHLVEPKAPQRHPADIQVPLMRRVKRPPEHTDTAAVRN